MMLRIMLLVFIGVILGLSILIHLVDRRIPINESTKTCLITGASSGIGRALAEEMVKRCWKVIGVGLKADLLAEVQKLLGADRFIPYVCDVSKLDAVQQASDDMKAKDLKPTLFFLNAGIRIKDEVGRVATADYQKVFAVNYFGVIAWVEQWLPTVKLLGGGTFVATSSVAALLDPMPGGAAYGATKVALINSFRSLRIAHINENIGFTVVLPGAVATAMGGPVGTIPFVHTPAYEARYIVDQVFKGKHHIEPSLFYGTFVRALRLLPDQWVVKAWRGFVALWVSSK